MSDRYQRMFERLAQRQEGAFVPFAVIGDPDPALSLEVLRTLARAGADALELGIAFSDPIADGPTIQAADLRALAAGTRPAHVWPLIQAVRAEFAELPIGLLIYANLVEARGADAFYATAAAAGVDSVLVADLPTLEAAPYLEAAGRQGVLPVMIAPPTADDDHLAAIASATRGYTYVVTRAGVTGVDASARVEHRRFLDKLRALGAPPALLGFGISRPEQVRAALAAGAAGAISGSAVVQIITDHLDDPPAMLRRLHDFVAAMKAGARS